ncbi:hypothetical protein EQ829_21920, partial [Ectopseudomonas mendocina]|uniref:hypothetical protein n=1 Tax=Ectopseudomonas mendocina TaxID=300 RepID=UPI00119127EC
VGGSVEWIESGRKEVLTAVSNAVECASRWREDAQPTRAVGAIGDDAQWLRISDDGETGTANRKPRPANSTPRWVF